MATRNKYYFLINSLETGGAERVIIRVAGTLAHDHDITIITLKDIRFYDLPERVQWHALSSVKNNFLMFLMTPYFVWKFRKYRKSEKFTSGISFLEISNFVHILSGKNAKISFRISLDFFQGMIGRVYLMLIRLLYPRALRIITNSSENSEDIENALKLEAWKVTTIHNPIDFSGIETALTETVSLPRYDKKKRKYITVGRLVWQKHHADIIRALAEKKKKGTSDFLYYIIGDGPERTHLENLVKSTGLETEVFFLGTQKNVFAHLKACDVFLYASEAEWFPNVLLEAVAIGLPIVTTDFKTGAREVIYGEYKKDITLPVIGPNGFLMRPKKFLEDFLALETKIDTLTQSQTWLDSYSQDRVAKLFEAELVN